MSVRTGYSGNVYPLTAYAAADTYYACTPFKMFYGADSVRLTLTNTVANAGTVTIKAEISNGASTPVYSQYGSEVTIAMTSGAVKDLLLPFRFCGGDTIKISFKESSVTSDPKLQIDCLAYLDGNDYVLGELAETVSSASDGTLALTVSSRRKQMVIGSGSNYVISLPDATTIRSGEKFEIVNGSSEFVVVKNYGTASSVFELLGPGCTSTATLTAAGSAAGTWVICCNDPIEFHDFNANSLATNYHGWNPSVGTGASVDVNNGVVESTTVGILDQATGTSSATAQAVIRRGPIGAGRAAVCIGAKVRMLQQASGAQDFGYELGLFTAISTLEATDGVFIRLPTNASTKTKWQTGAIKGSSAMTPVESAVDYSTAFVQPFVVLNSAGTRVDFYINKTWIASNTANIPAASTALYPAFKMISTVGTTTKVCRTDWIKLDYTSDRVRG